MKTSRKKTILITGLVVLVITVSNLILVEIQTNAAISKVDVGMTEDGVIAAIGSPSSTSLLVGQYGNSKRLEYHFPYLWDYVLWLATPTLTDQRKMSMGFSKSIRLTLSGETHTVLEVGKHPAYSEYTNIVKFDKSRNLTR